MSNVILTDVDDVLFDWTGDFTRWVKTETQYRPESQLSEFWNIEEWLGISLEESHELVNTFNNSPDHWPHFKAIEHSKKAIDDLTSQGWKFIAITACGKDEWIAEKRWENLNREYPNSFIDLHCVGVNESKVDILKTYSPTYWVEDKFKNAVDGADLGHKSFLIDYPHSRSAHDERVIRVKSWKEIRDYIIISDNK